MNRKALLFLNKATGSQRQLASPAQGGVLVNPLLPRVRIVAGYRVWKVLSGYLSASLPVHHLWARRLWLFKKVTVHRGVSKGEDAYSGR